MWTNPGDLGNFAVEGWVRLFHAPLGAGENGVYGQVHLFQGGAGLRWLVTGDDDLNLLVLQRFERLMHIRVQIIGVEVFPQTGWVLGLPPHDFGIDIKARPQDFECVAVRAVQGRHTAEYAEKRQPGHTEPVSPAAPDPGFIDERLADIKHHSLDHCARIAGVTTVFGSVADTYHDIRPGYPDWIAASIAAYHGAAPARVAEIGAGTGKGTRIVAMLGGQLTCVEPDARMAAHLPASAEVFIGTFEQWQPPAGGVDVLACAMAWHWTDEATRYPRALATLAPGGTLALFTHKYSYAVPAQLRAIDATFAAHGEPDADFDLFRHYREVADSGLFHRVQCEVRHADLTMTSAQFITLISTSSLYLNRAPAQQQELSAAMTSAIDSFDGTVVLDLRTILVLATPRAV